MHSAWQRYCTIPTHNLTFYKRLRVRLTKIFNRDSLASDQSGGHILMTMISRDFRDNGIARRSRDSGRAFCIRRFNGDILAMIALSPLTT